MSTDRKLLLVAACAAIVALAFALFSLREEAGPSQIPAGNHASDAQAAVAPPSTPSTPAAAGVSDATSTADYLPLSEGYLLTYLVEISHKGRHPRFGIARTSVEGREMIRGAEYYKVLLRVTGISEMKDPMLRYCRKSADAWHELDGAHKDDPAFEAVTLPLSTRAGVAWEKVTPGERSHWRVEGTETVSFLGKSYPNCLRVGYERRLTEAPDDFETGHYLLAPNIGLIQQVTSVSGTRMTFTLDHRSPEAIAFSTTWAGSYEAVPEWGKADGSIKLAPDGRYSIRKSKTDRGAETGVYERHPTRQGGLIFRAEDGRSSEYGLRTASAGDHDVLTLKCLVPGDLMNREYTRVVYK